MSTTQTHHSPKQSELENEPLLLHDIQNQPATQAPSSNVTILGTTPIHPFSILTFKWMAPLFRKGNEQDQLHPYDMDELPLPYNCKTDHVSEIFEKLWNGEKERFEMGLAESSAVFDNRDESLYEGQRDNCDDNEEDEKEKNKNKISNYGTLTKTKQKLNKRNHRHHSTATNYVHEPSLSRCLFKAFSSEYIQAGFLKLIHDANVFVGPIVLHGLIQFLRSTHNNNDIRKGLYLTAFVTVSQIIMSLSLRHYFFKCYLTGLRMRTAIVTAVYKKALVISNTERQRRSVGEIVNLMTVDAQRIQDVCTYGHAVWYSVLQIGLAIYFLWKQLGPSCLGGVAVIVIMIPANQFLAGWMGKLQSRLMEARDHRVEVNNEVLSSMKVIKLQAWEGSFKKRIQSLREIELKRLYDYVMVDALSIMMWTAVPILVAVATFTAYSLSGHKLDIANALTALALFDILRFPLFMLPQVMNDLVQASVSLERVKKFLLGEEHHRVGEGDIASDAGIKIHNATFVYDSKQPKMKNVWGEKKTEENVLHHELYQKHWEIRLLKAQLADAEKQLIALSKGKNAGNDLEEITPVAQVHTEGNYDDSETLLSLRRVNFQCNRGELIAIVGSVGSGKSTFINSILGEVRALSGTTAVKGRLAYCPQIPFIMNDTIKTNIIFGKQNESFDAERYNLSLSSCALEHDLHMFQDRDHTEIGEKGITLSGGQKSRIGMARAVYHDADIYLLDDPLAAVDAHVGKHLFQKCIVDELILNKSATSARKEKKSTVILVTNALQYLSDPNVDKIVVLDSGAIAEVGSYKELSENRDSLFSAFLSIVLETGAQPQSNSAPEYIAETNDQKYESESTIWNNLLSTVSPMKIRDEEHVDPAIDEGEGHNTQDLDTSPSYEGKFDSFSTSCNTQDEKLHSSKLMTNELVEREIGNVTMDVYLVWIRAAGGMLISFIIIMAYVIDQSIGVTSKWFLTYWSRKESDASSTATKHFLLIYAAINMSTILTIFGRVVLIYSSGLRASRQLFSKLLDIVLQAPMSFFDTTPTGRILNRFSKDVYTLDENLVSTMRSYLAQLFSVIGVIVIISSVTPYFTISLIPVIAFYVQQQKFFTKTYRELKRLDSVSRSPLYALLGETLDGIVTIRAYHAERTLLSRIRSMLDVQQNAYFLTFASQCWLGVRLELVGTFIIFSACLCAVLEYRTYGGSEIFAGLAGLSISFALNVTQALNWSVRMASDLEANMVSVERINQYCKIPSEASHNLPSDESLRYNWPSDGRIIFKSVKLRYRSGLPLVLKGLDFQIPPKSKVGVVGRTGAGKSTLMVSLLRIVELCGGSITIDGIDIVKVGLNLLRSKIAVIPQDPILFSGTIRTNLDPFQEYKDERLNEVLQRVGLKSTLKQSNSSSSLASLEGSTKRKTAKIFLSDEVLEGGSNYSVGQRQLIVIARSLLRGAKIVIMDEATASVDADTDARIQRVMRTEFRDSTCITVAHRINTIMDSDYILVMDEGMASEFDKPGVLLKRGGLFKDLVDAWEQEHNVIDE